MRTVNALRKELQILMQTKRTSRPPVLRRSLVEEWLYATDFPAAGGEGVQGQEDGADQLPPELNAIFERMKKGAAQKVDNI